MNLAPAPWRVTGAPNYRNIVDAEGLPVYAVAVRDGKHGGVEASEAHAALGAAARDLFDALVRLHARTEALLSGDCRCAGGSKDGDAEGISRTGETECEVCTTLRLVKDAIIKATSLPDAATSMEADAALASVAPRRARKPRKTD